MFARALFLCCVNVFFPSLFVVRNGWRAAVILFFTVGVDGSFVFSVSAFWDCRYISIPQSPSQNGEIGLVAFLLLPPLCKGRWHAVSVGLSCLFLVCARMLAALIFPLSCRRCRRCFFRSARLFASGIFLRKNRLQLDRLRPTFRLFAFPILSVFRIELTTANAHVLRVNLSAKFRRLRLRFPSRFCRWFFPFFCYCFGVGFWSFLLVCFDVVSSFSVVCGRLCTDNIFCVCSSSVFSCKRFCKAFARR